MNQRTIALTAGTLGFILGYVTHGFVNKEITRDKKNKLIALAGFMVAIQIALEELGVEVGPTLTTILNFGVGYVVYLLSKAYKTDE